MKHKVLKIDFRYLGGNIACLSVDSESGIKVHNGIDNEDAIKLFNCLIGSKENSILMENQELKQKLDFLTKRENKLQQIEQIFRSGIIDLDELRDIVLEKEN